MKLSDHLTIKKLPAGVCVYCEQGTTRGLGVPFKLVNGAWGHFICCVGAQWQREKGN